jgi:hypothetical protein
MVLHVRIFTALLAIAAVAAPGVALAQSTPAGPSYARASYGSDDEIVRGRIASFDGANRMQVDDDRGFVDNVQLQDGTVINPTGIRLAPGMSVTIHGVNRGSALLANVIDTPYDSYGATWAYPYPDYPYPYPVYGYPYPYPVYGYPYGPRFSIGIGIGFGGRGRFYGGGGFRGR